MSASAANNNSVVDDIQRGQPFQQSAEKMELLAADRKAQNIRMAVSLSISVPLCIGAVVTLAACTIVPVLIAVGVCAVISLIVLSIFIHKYGNASKALENVFKEAFDHNNKKFSAEKLQFFKTHGQYCTELSFLSCPLFMPAAGVTELGNYFSWLEGHEKNSRPSPSAKTLAFIKGLYDVSSAKRLQSLATFKSLDKQIWDINILYAEIEKLPVSDDHSELEKELRDAQLKLKHFMESITKGKVACDSPNETVDETDCWSGARVAEMIRSCPNLTELNLGDLCHYSEVIEACKDRKLNYGASRNDPWSVHRNPWNTAFPGMTV